MNSIYSGGEDDLSGNPGRNESMEAEFVPAETVPEPRPGSEQNPANHQRTPALGPLELQPGRVVPTSAPPEREPWHHSRGGMLLLLFVFLGPLALPLLWKNRRFPLPAKLLLTIAVGVLTAVAVWLLIWMIHYVEAQFHEVWQLLRA
ncbi:MAG: hypothetical protein ACOY3P_16055 [Planctomycetota bacterium]